MSNANKILRSDDIHIKGKVSLRMLPNDYLLNTSDRLFQQKEDIEKKIIDAKEEYTKIVKEMEQKKQAIIDEANDNSKVIEKRAYELGYEQGLKNGYEDGYKESYQQNIEKAIKESEAIKQEGYNTLLNIKSEAKQYIKDNKRYILDICISIAEQVLREKFEDIKLMDTMIENIIAEYDLKKDLIVKVNPIYKEKLENSIKVRMRELKLSQKVFIISDSTIEKGNAEIESGNGKLIVGIDSVLDKVREELL